MPDEGITPWSDVLPIIVCDVELARTFDVCGTGFLVADGLLVTCWHCVCGTLPPNRRYAVCRKRGPDAYDPFPLDCISQHPGGRDLALGRVPLLRVERLPFFEEPVRPAMHVWTFGYPVPQLRTGADGGRLFALGPRYLEGYVTRSFVYPEAMGGPLPAYELDMQFPGGLSGAPLFFDRTDRILGVAFGSNDVETIEEFASIHPETGERRSELRRVTCFGLAFSIATVLELSGPATNGRVLSEVI